MKIDMPSTSKWFTSTTASVQSLCLRMGPTTSHDRIAPMHAMLCQQMTSVHSGSPAANVGEGQARSDLPKGPMFSLLGYFWGSSWI